MRAKIGDRNVAKMLLEISRTESELPRKSGISHSNGGGCRDIYFDNKNGVVYKVDFPEGWVDDFYANVQELKNARYLRRRFPDGVAGKYVRIPQVSGFNVEDSLVIAMQKIEGYTGNDMHPPYTRKKEGMPRKWAQSLPARQELFKLKFRDMHGGNYIYDKQGFIWPVDMGSPRTWIDGCSPDGRILNDNGDF